MNQEHPNPRKLETIPSDNGDVLKEARGIASDVYSTSQDSSHAPQSPISEISSSSDAKRFSSNESKIRKRPSLKLKTEGGHRHSTKETDNLSLERLEAEIEALLIYTKAVKWPTLKQTVTEGRFLLRVFQLVFGLGAFLSYPFL